MVRACQDLFKDESFDPDPWPSKDGERSNWDNLSPKYDGYPAIPAKIELEFMALRKTLTTALAKFRLSGMGDGHCGEWEYRGRQAKGFHYGVLQQVL